jgi:RHS repeat-associated protein
VSATCLIENRWRTYIPSLGSYTSPDPEHRASVMSGMGPQAYQYASGRPLKYSDPDGRLLFDASWADAPADHFQRGLQAYQNLKKSKRCECVFKALWGSYPITNGISLGYRGTPTISIGGEEALGYTEGGRMRDLSSAFEPGIYVAAGVFAASGTGVAEGRIAHELAHFAFGAPHATDPTALWGRFAECPGYFCDSTKGDSILQQPGVPASVRKCAGCD